MPTKPKFADHCASRVPACGSCVRHRAIAAGWEDQLHLGFTSEELAELGGGQMSAPLPKLKRSAAEQKTWDKFAEKLAALEADETEKRHAARAAHDAMLAALAEHAKARSKRKNPEVRFTNDGQANVIPSEVTAAEVAALERAYDAAKDTHKRAHNEWRRVAGMLAEKRHEQHNAVMRKRADERGYAEALKRKARRA